MNPRGAPEAATGIVMASRTVMLPAAYERSKGPEVRSGPYCGPCLAGCTNHCSSDTPTMVYHPQITPWQPLQPSVFFFSPKISPSDVLNPFSTAVPIWGRNSPIPGD